MIPRFLPLSTRPGTRRCVPEMKTPLKLGLYGVGLVAIFAASFFVAGAIVPAGVQPQPTISEHGNSDHTGSAPASGSAS